MATRTQFRARVGEESRLLVRPVPTLTAAAAQSATAAALQDTSLSAAHYASGRWLYRPAAATSADYVRRCSAWTNSSGLFTHAGLAYSDTTATSETLEIWSLPPDLDPLEVNDCVNYALTRARRDAFTPFSIWTADADMENSGVGEWTASNASLTKSTSVLAGGSQSLSVAATSANGYAGGLTVNVTPGKTYFVATLAAAQDGTATLQAYDITNSAEIDSESTTNRDFTVLSLTFTAPSTCEQASIRLVQATSGQTALFKYLPGWQTGQTKIVAPTYIERSDDVFAIERLRFGANGQPARETERSTVTTRPNFDRDTAGGNDVRVELGFGLGSDWVFLRGQRRFSEMTAEADSATAKLDWIASGALMELYQRLEAAAGSQQDRSNYQRKALDWRKRWNRWCEIEQPRREENNRWTGVM